MLQETMRETTTLVSRTRPVLPGRGEAVERRRLERDMQRALNTHCFLLHYQPRVHLRSGAVSSSEALIRWPDRRRGMVPPATLIPAAERCGLINQIGAWVLQEACTEAMRWGGGIVSVNVSAVQLQTGALIGQLAAALDQSGLPGDRLELELTEAMLVDTDTDTLLSLSAIRDLGVGLALDDFGTGRASLSMLKRLPFTAIKLDRSLIRDLPGNREDAAIARAIVQAGHAIGLMVVAEGIETEEQRALLSGIGCDEGQGYLFSRPVPAAQARVHMESANKPAPFRSA